MSIQINPVDFRGFALGGAGVPQLPNVGALGLQAAQSVMSQQDAARNLAAQERMNLARIRSSDQAMLQQNIMERNKLAQQNNQFQQSLGLDRTKSNILQQQGLAEQAYKNQVLGQDSQRIGLASNAQNYGMIKDQQDAAREQLKLEMVQLANKKKEEVDNMGAFATQARMAMDKVTDPADARTLQLSILDEATKNKFISADVAKQMKQMPVSGFKNALDFKILQLDKVKEYKAMNDIQNPKAQSQGIEIIQPDGTVVKMQGLNKSTVDEKQKEILSKENTLVQFDNIEKNYNPDYFTYKNKAGAKVSAESEKLQGIPLVGAGAELLASTVTGKSPEERAKFLGERKAYMNNIEQTFNAYKKEITGAAAGEREIEQIRNSFINGDLSPSELKGALEQVRNRYQAEAAAARKALGQGIGTSTVPVVRKYNPATGRLE